MTLVLRRFGIYSTGSQKATCQKRSRKMPVTEGGWSDRDCPGIQAQRNPGEGNPEDGWALTQVIMRWEGSQSDSARSPRAPR